MYSQKVFSQSNIKYICSAIALTNVAALLPVVL